MSKRHTPIFSSREDDPDLREALDEFTISLAERVDVLQDAELAADLDGLGPLCASLAGEAERLGFAPLADAANRVACACSEDKADAAQEALIELTDVARRVRLGHRGAF